MQCLSLVFEGKASGTDKISLLQRLFNPSVQLLFQVLSHEDDGVSQQVLDGALGYMNLV